jgi:hypothetical protein
MNLKTIFLLAGALLTSAANADPIATHGMLLFGKQATYASHLPMFHAPHDYQVILKLRLVDHPRQRTLLAYEQAKADGNKLFTLVPTPLDLTKVISGELTTFYAQLFAGHFERGGTELGSVRAHVEKVLFSAKLKDDQPDQQLERYVVFGENGEYFGAHIIAGKPSFDSIVQVAPVMNLRTPCNTRLCVPPLQIPDSSLPMSVSAHEGLPEIGDGLSNPEGGENTTIRDILYLEVDELSH